MAGTLGKHTASLYIYHDDHIDIVVRTTADNVADIASYLISLPKCFHARVTRTTAGNGYAGTGALCYHQQAFQLLVPVNRLGIGHTMNLLV